ncbi:calcium/sodium antiporter [Flavisolibacter sp. BT320]|nr:calcium/sodium antiporter [Flavisolibacter longurius]
MTGFSPLVIFLIGLVVITSGAELLLRNATRIAAMLGIKPILIGLTVVSIGTSMPELAVGIKAVQEGKGPMAVGNIAGTNIINILFILGLSAAIRPLKIHLQSIKLDVPVMIATSFALILMAMDGKLERWEGIVLLVAAIIYLVILVRTNQKESAEVKKEFGDMYENADAGKTEKPKKMRGVLPVVLLLASMALTIWGADLLVTGAVSIAQAIGVSDAVIGLTIVAIGTSAPELATTIVATYKNDRDVAVGNLIGSSITNVLVILGLTCLAAKSIDVSNDILFIDLPLAAVVAIVCYPVFRSDRMVSRMEGVLFVTLYLLYLAWLLIFRM